MNRKHRRHTLFAVLAALAVACQDAPAPNPPERHPTPRSGTQPPVAAPNPPETPDTVATPEAPVPGDPAQYAPDGWPLRSATRSRMLSLPALFTSGLEAR